MSTRPQPKPPTQNPAWRWRIAAAAALLLLGGCANGDFGEVRPSLVRDDIHDWISREAIAGRPTVPSGFELTDDERQLRDLAYPMIEWPYNRQKEYSVLGEYGVTGGDYRGLYDRTGYATHLLADRYRSPSARYAQLTDDIRNDSTRIGPFFDNAGRVLNIDDKRQRSLAYVSAFSGHERRNALRRIRENQLIVGWVHASLRRRASAYQFALERLVIMTPSPLAVDAERALNELRVKMAQYQRVGPSPPRGTRTADLH